MKIKRIILPDGSIKIEVIRKIFTEEEERIREEKRIEDKKNKEKENYERYKKQQEYIKNFIKEHPDCDQKLIRRFFSKVDIRGENECWIWLGFIQVNGYGQVSYKGKPSKTHRISWLVHNGEIPEGMHVLHRCDNKKCINPKCLWLGTQQENVEDMLNKNRGYVPKGDKHGRSKLVLKEVIEIKEKYNTGKYTYNNLSKEYNVSAVQIFRIVKNEQWKTF